MISCLTVACFWVLVSFSGARIIFDTKEDYLLIVAVLGGFVKVEIGAGCWLCAPGR
jgi:hypothetical protein